jgi:hypothetical protein
MGQIMIVKYFDGEKKIIVPPDTPVVRFVPDNLEDLKPGAQIFIVAWQKMPDGTVTAPAPKADLSLGDTSYALIAHIGCATPSRPTLIGAKSGLMHQQRGIARPLALRRSIPPLRIDNVDHAQVRRPIGRAAAGIVTLVLVRGLFADLCRDFDQVAAGRFHF